MSGGDGILGLDLVDGYLDGLDRHSQKPADNRSESYRFGFAKGRNDLHNRALVSAQVSRFRCFESEVADRHRMSDCCG